MAQRSPSRWLLLIVLPSLLAAYPADAQVRPSPPQNNAPPPNATLRYPGIAPQNDQQSEVPEDYRQPPPYPNDPYSPAPDKATNGVDTTARYPLPVNLGNRVAGYAPPAGQVPGYAPPAGQVPGYAPPAGQLSGSAPAAERIPSYAPATGQVSGYAQVAGQFPSDPPPDGQVPGYRPPTGQIPSYAPPSGQVPGYAPPSGQIPGYAPPSGQIPGYAPPSGQIPGYAPPSGQIPGYGPAAGSAVRRPLFPAPGLTPSAPPQVASSVHQGGHFVPGLPPATPPFGGPPRATAAAADIFEPARIVARVGDELILAGDLLPQINQALEPYEGKMPAEKLEQQRELYMQKMVDKVIENKLVYLHFLQSIPADRFEEVWNDLQKRIAEEYESGQLEKSLETAKVGTPAELDAKLRRYGSSLAKQKRAYGERQLSALQIRREVEFDPEVTHEEMLQRYRDNLEDYHIPAAARWEQLTSKKSRFASKSEAFQAVANMGNEVLRGAPLHAVAKRHSHGPNALEGGQHDWTTKGSLVSTVLDRAIFELPPNQLSPIIEDDQGFHIIRVLQRRTTKYVPFTEAQVKIKESLREEKVREAIAKYIAELRDKTPVWTIFDDQPTEG